MSCSLDDPYFDSVPITTTISVDRGADPEVYTAYQVWIIAGGPCAGVVGRTVIVQASDEDACEALNGSIVAFNDVVLALVDAVCP